MRANTIATVFVGLATLTGLTGGARADHFADQQNELLRRIEYGQSRYNPPTWFDGKSIPPSAIGMAFDTRSNCRYAIDTYKQLWNTIDPAFRSAPRGQAVQQKYQAMVPACEAIGAALARYESEQKEREARAAEEQRLERERDRVRQDLWSKLMPYETSITPVMIAFVDIETSNGFAEQPQFVAKYKKDWAEVQKVCAAFPNITNPPHPPARNQLRNYPVEVCQKAALGPDEAIRQHRKAFLQRGISSDVERYTREVQPILDGQEKAISDLIQKLAYDRKAWSAIINKNLAASYERIGEPIPDDLWQGLDPVAEKLRSKLDSNAATDTFKAPPYHDAQVEGLVRKQAATELKGAKVMKSGLDYASWVAYDERTWVKSDAKYDYFRVSPGKNRYKRGWILVQLAGQPHCQAREFIVSRVLSGPIHVDSLDGGGRYVKCE